MSNPFEDDSAEYRVLINDEGQYSIWPIHIDVPEGWTIVHLASRQECLDYIDEHWTDMRPRSLIRAMDGDSAPN